MNILFRCKQGTQIFVEILAYIFYLIVISYLAYMNGIHNYGILGYILVGLIFFGYIFIPELISLEWFPNSQEIPEKTKDEIEENCQKRFTQFSYYYLSLKKFLIVITFIAISFQIVRTVTPVSVKFGFLNDIYDFIYNSKGGYIFVIVALLLSRIDISILKQYDPEDNDLDDKYTRRLRETNMISLWVGIIFIFLLVLRKTVYSGYDGVAEIAASAPTGE